MTERNQVRGPLRRHDSGDPRDAEHVALLDVRGDDRVERLRAASESSPSLAPRAPCSALAETSTIRASPLSDVCVNPAAAHRSSDERRDAPQQGRGEQLRIHVAAGELLRFLDGIHRARRTHRVRVVAIARGCGNAHGAERSTRRACR